MEKQASRKPLWREIAGWVVPGVVGVLAAWTISTFVFYLPHVRGESMEDTFHDGDVLLCTRVYDASRIRRYDVLTVDWDGTQIVKRVYGLPGEVISVTKDRELVVDGVLIDDPYAKEAMESAGILEETPIFLSEGEFFLLGDNRNNSNDSRFDVGVVQFEDVCGKYILRVWKERHSE